MDVIWNSEMLVPYHNTTVSQPRRPQLECIPCVWENPVYVLAEAVAVMPEIFSPIPPSECYASSLILSDSDYKIIILFNFK
jgi:hypothetical protein